VTHPTIQVDITDLASLRLALAIVGNHVKHPHALRRHTVQQNYHEALRALTVLLGDIELAAWRDRRAATTAAPAQRQRPEHHEPKRWTDLGEPAGTSPWPSVFHEPHRPICRS
jgi:hypothetical protein